MRKLKFMYQWIYLTVAEQLESYQVQLRMFGFL